MELDRDELSTTNDDDDDDGGNREDEDRDNRIPPVTSEGRLVILGDRRCL